MNKNCKKNGFKTAIGVMFATALFFMPNMNAEAEESTESKEINGVYYTLENEDGDGGVAVRKAYITGISAAEEIVIPETVENEGENYQVLDFQGDDIFGSASEQNHTLKSLTIEANVNMSENFFKNCTALETFTTIGQQTVPEHLFVGKDWQGGPTNNETLKTVSITGATIKGQAFAYCTGLTELQLTDVAITGAEVFKKCKNLKDVTLENIEFQGSGDGIFGECERLENITMTNITKIPQSTFDNCRNLKSITIPNGVTEIGKGALANCSNLTQVTILGSNVNLNATIFSGSSNLKTVYVTTEEMKSELEAHFKNAYNNRGDRDFEEYATNVVVININAEDEIDTSVEFTYIQPTWEPTTPEEIYAFGLRGNENPIYKVLEGKDPVAVYNEVQGPLCINVMKVAADQFTLARTYNILINEKYIYNTEDGYKIALEIPNEFRQDGREFKMICVTKDGAYSVLNDLDQEDETITFKTSDFHAFGLCYQD